MSARGARSRRVAFRRREGGASIVEFVIVAPLLLLLGLGLVQAGLIFHGRGGLEFALQEAARRGSVNNGSMESIRAGLQDGLIPYMGGGTSLGEIATTRARVAAEFARGTATGWIRVRQISPTPQSFTDWAQNTRDDMGNAVYEIPNANLAVLRCTQAPNRGASGTKSSTACPGGGEQVGTASRQTLADANLLKLELTYGMRLNVPVFGRLVGEALSMMAGCRPAREQRMGALNLDRPEGDVEAACAFYEARDLRGRPEPRIPVRMAITVRMQSPPRVAANAGWFEVQNRERDPNVAGRQLGLGYVGNPSDFRPIPVSTLNPNGVSYSSDAALRWGDAGSGRGNGSLRFGADTSRTFLGGGGGGPQCGVTMCCL